MSEQPQILTGMGYVVQSWNARKDVSSLGAGAVTATVTVEANFPAERFADEFQRRVEEVLAGMESAR